MRRPLAGEGNMKTAVAALFQAAVLLLAWALPAAAAPPITWTQDFTAAQKAAAANKHPLVIFFIGNGKFDQSLFDLPAFDAVSDRAEFVFVGADMDDEVTDDQKSIEAVYQVDTYPSLLMVDPIFTTDAAGKTDYSMRIRVRCATPSMAACAATIAAAINAGQ